MKLTPEQEQQRHKRNVAVAWALVALVALFFVMTIVRLGGNVGLRDI
jgi:hypothetical protein